MLIRDICDIWDVFKNYYLFWWILIYVKVNYLAPAAKTRTHDLYVSRLLPLKHEKHTAKKLGMVHWKLPFHLFYPAQ